VTTSKVSFLFSKDKENAIFGEMLSWLGGWWYSFDALRSKGPGP